MKADEVLELIAHQKTLGEANKRQLIQKLKNEQLDVTDRYRVLCLAVRWLAASPNQATLVVPLGAIVIKTWGCGHPQSLATLVKKKLLSALWAMDQSAYVEGSYDRQVEIVNATHWILSQLVGEDDEAASELCDQVRSHLPTFLSRVNPSRLGPALGVSRLIKQHPRCLFLKEHITKTDSGKKSGVCEEVLSSAGDDEDEELEMKVCESLIKSIGSLTIPTPDVINLETFASQVREVAEGVALIWRKGRPPSKGKHVLNGVHDEEEKRVFRCLQIIHSLVSEPGKERRDPCPALASILQLVPLRLIPGAVTGVLGSGNGSSGTGEGTVAALLCHLLCDWLLRWPGASNLSHWVLALLQGLAPSYPSNTHSPYSSNDTNNNRRVSLAACESRVRILVALTLSNIDKLVEGLNDPSLCQSLLPVVSHMLLGFQHSPEPFLKVCPHLPPLLSRLRDDREDGVPGSAESLQLLVDLCSMLLFLHGGSDPTRQHLREALEDCPLPSMGVPNQEYLLRLRWIPLSVRSFGSYDSFSLPPQVPVPESTGAEWTPAVYRAAERAGHVGLSNLGNTCYANSVLQALFMTTRFRRRVLLSSVVIPQPVGPTSSPSIWGAGTLGTWGRVFTGPSPPPKTRPVLSQLRLLFALLSHSPRPSLSPQAILTTAHMAGGHFEFGQQHDCSEFMCFFLDALHEQGRAYARSVGKESEEELEDDVGMLKLEPEEDNRADGDSEDRANSTQEEEEEEDADMDDDEEDMQDEQVGMKRWTTEEDLSSSEGRRLQAKRKALSLAEFSSVTAAETDSGQDVDEKSSETAETDVLAQGAQPLSDSHSDSTDSGIQSVGEEDGVNTVLSVSVNPANVDGDVKTVKQPNHLAKGEKQASVWTESSDPGKLKKEFCSIVQQEFGGVAHTMHQCLSCGSVSIRSDPFRDLQLAFPEDAEETVCENSQESKAFIGPQLPEHMLPANDPEKEETKEKESEKIKEEMEVEDKVTAVKKQHSGPWGVSDLLGHYLSTETLRGENRYRCTKCKGLQDAQRSVSLAWPPPRHLLLTLKHFQFDRNTSRRSKALRPLKVELSLEVPVALSRNHRSNAAKRRKTRSTQSSAGEECGQKKKADTEMESSQGKSDVKVKESGENEDGAPSCSNTEKDSTKESEDDPKSPELDTLKPDLDAIGDEAKASGSQDCGDGGNYSRRRRRTRREEEGASIGRGERAYVEERKVTYRLYAAIVHSGFSLDGGHYYTYARRPQVSNGADGEEWCMLNDSQVSVQSGPESFSEPSGHRPQDTPYVLFYMLEGLNSATSPDWWSLPVELRDAVEADGSKYIREEQDWRWKHPARGRPGGGGGFNRRDGDDPPPSSCGGGMGSGIGSMGGHFVF